MLSSSHTFQRTLLLAASRLWPGPSREHNFMFRLGEIFEVGILRRQLWNSGPFPKYTGLWGQVKFWAAQGADHEASGCLLKDF